MSKRLVMAIPDEHYAWLEELAKVRGVETVQDAARAVLAEMYKADKTKKKRGKIYEQNK